MEKKRILVLCDDYWHPAEVIERGLTFLMDDYALDFVHDAKDILTPDFIREYPMVINAKMDEIGNGNKTVWFQKKIAETQVSDFEDYVKDGYGFLALHAGNSYFWDQNKEYCQFNGCAFVTHPDRCDIRIKVIKDHPITEGLMPFTVRDEHYEVNHLKKDLTILMEGTSKTGGTQPACYVHTLGKGRMCSILQGHIYATFRNEEFQKLVKRSIRWCLKEI